MVPPKGYTSLPWDMWSDGKLYELYFETRGECMSFTVEFGKRMRMRGKEPISEWYPTPEPIPHHKEPFTLRCVAVAWGTKYKLAPPPDEPVA